jgi:hypothetical protein
MCLTSDTYCIQALAFSKLLCSSGKQPQRLDYCDVRTFVLPWPTNSKSYRLVIYYQTPILVEDIGLHSLRKKRRSKYSKVTTEAMYVLRNIGTRSRNHFCSAKAICSTKSERASVALLIQRARRMCLVIIPSMACPDLQYFSTSH